MTYTIGKSALKGLTSVFAIACFLCVSAATPAFAASDAVKERVVPLSETDTPLSLDDETIEPIPDDALPTIEPDPAEEPDGMPDDTVQQKPNREPPPPIQRDLSKLPEPVARMRTLILEAAKTGDIEKLRPLVGFGETATTFSIGGLEGDPIEFLKEASGDEEGYEILAILIEVLEAGYVIMDEGTDNELFVWPYFFAWPLDMLTPEMRVELFRILTAGDVEDSENFGGYVFYRAGIKPDGTWRFFVAGD